MEPNEQKDVDLNNEEALEVDLDVEEAEQKGESEAEKPKESKEAKKARLERQLKRLNKELGVEEPKTTEKATPNDLGEKAYLIANGIKDADEIKLAKNLAKETGKDIESLLATTYFQTELKNLREERATEGAIPKKNKRANNSSTDSVEYWMAKGELPPSSEVELRRQVVNARMKREEAKGQFYNS